MLEPRNFYRVENMVRAVTSRLQRQSAVVKHRAVAWVLGKRVLPRVPLLITAKEFEDNKVSLLAKVQLGEISIVRPDQVRIDSNDAGQLLYFVPGKPPTSVEPPLAVTLSPLVPQGEAPTSVVPEGVTGLDELVRQLETPEFEGVVETPDSEKVTAELPVPDEAGPRVCIQCRELPATEDSALCANCAARGAQPDEVPQISLDTTAQEETPVEEPAAEEFAETEHVGDRQPKKKKGKKS
jgi:hypothetical protein